MRDNIKREVLIFRSDYFTGKKKFYGEKKSNALYSSTHTLCGVTVRVRAKLRC